ncbi:MAG TPA: urate hydroxylase PuuD [Candidatus Limnocylindria bacterium]
MEPYLAEWFNLLVRWLHVVAAIAWIGSSFYFIALDYSLQAPKDPRDAARGVAGESWEIHGGGFYRVEKFRVAPETLPERLNWFKWEAYTTWLSGFLLLVGLYYLNTRTYLIDPAVADLTPLGAIGISIGILAVGWFVYDGLCRLLDGHDRLLAAILAAFVIIVAYGTSQLFSGRAVYIQVGAMIGTWMAANVFFVIIPGHWDLVRAKQAGKTPDAKPGLRGKQRSVHNNYLTLPAIFAMLGNHFPMTYGHDQGWLILVVIMGISIWIRHFFNLRHQGRTVWAIPLSAAIAMAFLAFAIAPPRPGSSAETPPEVPFETAHGIIQTRCLPCHSRNPTYEGITAPPQGITFETFEQIQALAPRIEQMAVILKAMPPSNVTGMTEGERETLGAWIRQGTKP